MIVNTTLYFPFTRFVLRLVLAGLILGMFPIISQAQTVTIPSSNVNDSSNRKPYGCFYGYERSHLLFLSSEIGPAGSIIQIGFYLNSVSNPTANTPVVIKFKETTDVTITPDSYDNASAGSTLVYTGTITSAMLTPGDWVTVILDNPFAYSGNNLAVFIETNFGQDGDELFNAKQFRQSLTASSLFEYWEQDYIPPTDNGQPDNHRPNTRFKFAAACSGTPVPGATLSTVDTACADVSFTLSMENISLVPGLTYQWESSGDGNTWVPIPTATSYTYDATLVAPTWYRAHVTCSAGGDAYSDPLLVDLKPFYNCYCASYALQNDDSKIDSVHLNNVLTGSPANQCETYTDYTSLTADLTPGWPATVHIVNGSCSGNTYPLGAAVYIDFNQNTSFADPGEQVYGVSGIMALNTIPDGTFVVPSTATTGRTGMRVVLEEGQVIPGPCDVYSFGETEDYTVNIIAVPACSGLPAPGNTLSTSLQVCPGETFILSIQNYVSASGITYQWQYSTNLSLWNNLSLGTGPTYSASQSSATYFRCQLTCTASGLSAYSNYVQVTMNPFYNCYCASYAINPEDTKLDSVILGTIVTGSDTSQCETYEYHAGITTALAAGASATIHLVNGSCSGDYYDPYVGVYIDYNHNGNFTDANELVYSFGPTSTLNSIPDGTFTVPVLAATGTTGMRVIITEDDTIPFPCGTYDYGETEDFLVSIFPACSGIPNPGQTVSSANTVCPNEPFTLSLQNALNNSGLLYQWESSTDALNWTTITGAVYPTLTLTQSSATYYQCEVTCNTGGTGTSGPLLVNVNALNNCYCASGAINLNDTKIDSVKIGTIVSGSPSSQCATYTDHTALSTDLPAGLPSAIHIVNGSCSGIFHAGFAAVYIDYNQDGSFDETAERAWSFGPTTGLNTIPNGTFTVPVGTPPGVTRMRVVLSDGATVPPACGNYQEGETEDFSVNIVTIDPCQEPPNAGTAEASDTAMCSSAVPATIQLSLVGNSIGLYQTYQWETSSDGIFWSPISGDTLTDATVTVTASAYYRNEVTCGLTTVASVEVFVLVMAAPVGNTISDPIIIGSLPYQHNGDNFAANCWSIDYMGPHAQSSPDVFFQLVAPDIGKFDISLCNGSTIPHSYLHVLDSLGNEVAYNGGNGPLCAGNQASITYDTVFTNQKYFVVVQGLGTDTGNYSLEISFTEDTTFTNSTPSQHSLATSLEIYPNPSNGDFTVSVHANDVKNGPATLELINPLGQVVKTQHCDIAQGIATAVFSNEKLPKGIYQVRARGSGFAQTGKIIIQ